MTVAPPNSSSSNPHTQPSLCCTLVVSQRSLAPSTLLHPRTQESALLHPRTLIGFGIPHWRCSVHAPDSPIHSPTLSFSTYSDSSLFACFIHCSTRRLRRMGKEPTALFTKLATALPTRPLLSRRFALSRRMKAFLALQFTRFLYSRKCSTGILLDNWSLKGICRKTTDTGRMRYLRHVPCRFKCSFREGIEAAPRKKGAAASGETVHGNRHHLGQALLEETRVALQVYKVSIGAACNLSWPADCLVIQVLDDSTEPAIKQMVEIEC